MSFLQKIDFSKRPTWTQVGHGANKLADVGCEYVEQACSNGKMSEKVCKYLKPACAFKKMIPFETILNGSQAKSEKSQNLENKVNEILIKSEK